MTELEMCETLGILLDPDKNHVSLTEDLKQDIQQVSRAFCEATCQRKTLGTVNHDIWLEFIPWHSNN